MQAAGGLWTTPSDLARFIIEVQLSYTGKSNKVLSRETVKTMLTPYVGEAPGFFIKQMMPGGQKYFNHAGIIKGFKSEYYGSMDGGYGVVVMINSDGGSGNIVPEVINSVATVYKWKDFYEPEIRKKPVAADDGLLAKCEGVYLYDDKYVVILNKPDGGHYWSAQQDSRMHFTGRKQFFTIESPSDNEIVMDAKGNVTAIRRSTNGRRIATATKLANASTAKCTTWQLAEIGWYLLENKRYDQALSYFKHLSTLEPGDVMARCNMAHCMLFSGDNKKAIEIYREILLVDDGHTFRQSILDDFAFFKRNGFEAGRMNLVIAELKLGGQK